MKRFKYVLIPLLLALMLLPARAAEPVWDVTTAEDSWFTAPAPRLMSASDSQLEALEHAMRQAVWEGKQTFTIDYDTYGITYQELREALNRLYYAPETFAVDNYYSSNYGTYATVRPVYYSNLINDYDAARQVYLDGIAAITAGIDPGWSDLGKVLYVNDYLCLNFAYDNSYQIYDAYGFFKYGVGVCQAYTRVFQGVMDALNIRSSFVDSDSLNHTWNIVQVGGRWYHIDVTWNDPSMIPEHQANHEYFLLSTGAMKAARDHFEQDDWRFGRDVTCSDTRYDSAFWQSSVSPFVPYGDGWLYVSADGLVRWDADHDSRTLLADYGSIFSEIHSGYSFGSYVWRSGLAVRSGKIYFNSWYDVLCYDIYTGKTTCLASLLDAGKNIHSCWIEGDSLVFQSGNDHYKLDLPQQKMYTITWEDDDGSLLGVTRVPEGEIPTRSAPQKPGDGVFEYVFMGWTPQVTAAYADATYKATYMRMEAMYSITWLDDDGSVIDVTSVMPSLVPSHYPPQKVSSGPIAYVFDHWTPAVEPAYGDATYQAVYREVVSGTRVASGRYTYRVYGAQLYVQADEGANVIVAAYGSDGCLEDVTFLDSGINAFSMDRTLSIFSLDAHSAPLCAALVFGA